MSDEPTNDPNTDPGAGGDPLVQRLLDMMADQMEAQADARRADADRQEKYAMRQEKTMLRFMSLFVILLVMIGSLSGANLYVNMFGIEVKGEAKSQPQPHPHRMEGVVADTGGWFPSDGSLLEPEPEEEGPP